MNKCGTIVTMLLECGILQMREEHFYFNLDKNADEYEIVARGLLHKYTLEHIHSWCVRFSAESIEVEESNADIPELMDSAYEEFEILDSDFED